MPMVTADYRYPIGKYEPQPFSIERKVEWLAEIKFLPLALESAILNLDEQQLQTPYREDGWTATLTGKSPSSTCFPTGLKDHSL